MYFFFVFLISIFMEILYLSIMLPLVNLTSNYNKSGTIDIHFLNKVLIDYSNEEILFVLYSISILVILSSIVSVIFLRYKIIELTISLGMAISNNLFKKLIREDYQNTQKRDNADTISLISIENNRLIHQVFFPIGNFIYSSILFIGIFLVLMFYNPIVSFFVLTFIILIYYLFFKYLRKSINYYGKLKTNLNINRFKLLQSSFSMVVNIKLNNLYEFFFQKLKNQNETYLNLDKKLMLISFLPKYIIETVVFLTIIFFFLFLIVWSKDPYTYAIDKLTMIAFFGIKLIPTFHSMYTAGILFKANNNVLYKYLSVFADIEQKKPKNKLIFKNIKFENLSFSINETTILNDLSLDIKEGDKVLVIGKSGSGKTTLGKILVGLYNPNDGKIYINGKLNSNFIFENSFYLTQEEYLMPETISENIALGVQTENINYDRIKDALKSVELEYLNNLKNTANFNSKVGDGGIQLSAGQIQRILLARIFYKKFDFIILDEPTSALDSKTATLVIRKIMEVYRKKTVIIISHDLSFRKQFNKVIELN